MENVVRLSDLPSRNASGYFLHSIENETTLFNRLKEVYDQMHSGNGEMKNNYSEMEGITIDISEVIICPLIAEYLSKLVKLNGVRVVDYTKNLVLTPISELPQPLETLEEGKDYVKHVRSDGVSDKSVYLVDGTITFRHDYFEELFLKTKRTKAAVLLKDYFEVTTVGNSPLEKRVFTRNSAQALLGDIKAYRETSDYRFLISFAGLSSADPESLKQIAAFIISQNDFIEIINESAKMTFSIDYLLPMISQLCCDHSTIPNSWVDIKHRYPVGTFLYISPNNKQYVKYQVTENYLHDERGQYLLGDNLSDLPPFEKNKASTMTLKIVDESEVQEGGIITSTFTVSRIQFINLNLLIFPCAIFENTDYKIGMPNKENGELKKFVENTVFRPRGKMALPSDFSIFQVEEQTNATTSWIVQYQKAIEKQYRARGMEPPYVDLMEVMRNDSFHHRATTLHNASLILE